MKTTYQMQISFPEYDEEPIYIWQGEAHNITLDLLAYIQDKVTAREQLTNSEKYLWDTEQFAPTG